MSYTIKKSSQLRRSDNASDIPAIDRAIAAATCRLLIALDRESIEDLFFSRALAACEMSWVWPELVLRKMAASTKKSRRVEPAVPAAPIKVRKVPMQRIMLPQNDGSDDHLPAKALTDPDRALEWRSGAFMWLGSDCLHRLMVAEATLAWLDEAPDPERELHFLQNARYLSKALGLDASGTAIVELMSLAAQSNKFKLAISAIRCASMNMALNTVAKWVGGHRIGVEAFFRLDGTLVQCGLHSGLARNISNLDDALRIDNPTFAEKLSEFHESEQSFVDSFLQVAQAARLTTDAVPQPTRPRL